MTHVIEAKGLSKSYGSFQALKSSTFTIPLGRIVGIIGANGAGKTTMLNAILGLSSYDGDLSVLGLDPSTQRKKLMEDVSFISDVATLPKWMRVNEILDYVEGVHPKFSKEKALDYLSKTKVPLNKKIKALSKGMIVQLHLAIVMSIDAKLLVLDEPTLGLDIIFRKGFYANLLEEYFDQERTIIITTHQVEEIEHILSDVIFIEDGEIVMDAPLDELAASFTELVTDEGGAEEARKLGPLTERTSLGRYAFVFEGVEREKLKALGEAGGMGLADIFVAKMTGEK